MGDRTGTDNTQPKLAKIRLAILTFFPPEPYLIQASFKLSMVFLPPLGLHA